MLIIILIIQIKDLFFILKDINISIFAFSSIANATDFEDFDSEIDEAFQSTTLTNSAVPQTLPEDFLSKNRAALATRLSRINPAALEIDEEEKFGKRKREENSTITQPIPNQDVFKEPTERKETRLTW